MSTFYRIKDDVFEAKEAGPWTALIPVKVEKADDLRHRWDGGRISLDQVRQILSFFHWSYAETKSESMCHLFYHEAEERWEPVVLPQKGYQGMTVSLIDAAENIAGAIRTLGLGWELGGTWHHHCSASAFQSGTDHKDEQDTPGLHLTSGGIGEAKYSVHVRSSFKRTITDVWAGDWFELPPVLNGLSATAADTVIRELLRIPAKDHPFPAEWKERVIKQPPQEVMVWKGNGWSGDDDYYDRRYRGDSSAAREKMGWRPAMPIARGHFHDAQFTKDVQELLQAYELSPAEALAWLREINDAQQPLRDLINVASENWASLPDIIDEVESLDRQESLAELDRLIEGTD